MYGHGTVGLIVWGVSVDKGYHWIVGEVAFFLCAYTPSPSVLVIAISRERDDMEPR